jgi:site-specific DNA recombinase
MGSFDIAPRHEDTTELEDIRAAVYARTSSASQRFGYSIGEQVRQCLQCCQRLNWDVVYVFRDEAESGKNTERPMFQEMMQKARSGRFSVVVFWKLDRFSRSLLHAVQLEAELREEDVALHSVTEQIDTISSAGRFNFRNIANAAEFERDMISERSRMGMKALAMEGRWPNNHPPLGYQRTDDGSLEIDDIEAEHVHKIFERYVDIQSMPQVANELNQEEIPTKKGGEWTPRTVSDILRNELYIGAFDMAGVSDHYEKLQIIDEDLFEQATETRRRFRSNGQSQRDSMPKDRKSRIVDEMKEMYQKFIEEHRDSRSLSSVG